MYLFVWLELRWKAREAGYHERKEEQEEEGGGGAEKREAGEARDELNKASLYLPASRFVVCGRPDSCSAVAKIEIELGVGIISATLMNSSCFYCPFSSTSSATVALRRIMSSKRTNSYPLSLSFSPSFSVCRYFLPETKLSGLLVL